MEGREVTDAPLQDYPNRSVWTTWVISYQAIRNKHEATAKLLLLWSFLDNKDLWHGLFATTYGASTVATRMLSDWIGDIASNELVFSQAMQLLRSYSLIEEVQDAASYATHPVVHRWAYYYEGEQFASMLGPLAVVVVGRAVPDDSTIDWSIVQRRLLPHAQAGSRWIVQKQVTWRDVDGKDNDEGRDEGEAQVAFLDAIHCLGLLYAKQGKLGEAEQMYERALRGYEEALGPNHTLTLGTVNNLGLLYKDQGKLVEAEQMYKRALQGYEEALGPNHTLTLDTVINLGILYKVQGKLMEAGQMLERALRGREKAFGPNHTSTLGTVNNLGNLYKDQGKLGEAERMYNWALRGREEALGSSHTLTLQTVNNLGLLYTKQGKLGEAEQMYERALRGKEEALGSNHTSTLDTVNNLGLLYTKQGKLGEAEHMYERALRGKEEALGPNHTSTLFTVNNLGLLYAGQGKLGEAEQLYERALRGYEEALGKEGVQQYMPALNTLQNIGRLYAIQGETVKAQATYTKALSGLRHVLGQSCDRCIDLAAQIDALSTFQSGTGENQELLARRKWLRFSIRELVRKVFQ
jgi:tetratricopeptide (TPR) repeat protein